MIPLRVQLKGFLCYKEEQEVSFDGSSLWMLSGLNGSGKSAVFDAVTYALFSHHRGGKSDAQELVNKNSDGFEVEFDFLQDGHAYRIRRTLKLKSRGGPSSAQQIFKRAPHGQGNGNGQPAWEAVPDTSKRDGFNDWIRNNIGLDYETFTSSVLLLQGNAEKLVGAKPKERFEVLAGIVDLERYQKLHERADARKKAQSGKLEALVNQLSALPIVEPIQLLEVQGRVNAAEVERDKAGQEVERLLEVQNQARQYQEMQVQREQVRRKLQQTEALLTEAGAIERDEQRLKELQSVLPAVKSAVEQRHGLEEAERTGGELQKHAQKIEADLGDMDETLARTREKRSSLEKALEAEDRQHKELGTRLREAGALLEKLKECDRQEQELERVQKELKQLGADPSAQVRQARDACERLMELAQVAPKLARFAELRQQLVTAVEHEKKATEARQKVEQEGKKLNTQLDELKVRVDEARREREQAVGRATEAATLLGEAQRLLEEVQELHGAKVCRACGQKLTKAHLEQEKVRRQKTLDEKSQEHERAVAEQRQAQQAEDDVRKEFEKLEQKRNQARDEYRDHVHHMEQARKDVQRLHADCTRIHGELPAVFAERITGGSAKALGGERSAVSVRSSPLSPKGGERKGKHPSPIGGDDYLVPDWRETTYPTAVDIKELEKQAQGLATARKQLSDAETLATKWNQQKGREASLLETLRQLTAGLPRDRQSVRRQHTDLEVEEKALASSMKTRREALVQTQRELEDLGRQRDKIQQELGRCRADAQAQLALQENHRQALERHLRELPEAWRRAVATARFAQITDWTGERDDLIARNTEQRAEQLRQARLAAAGLKQEANTLDEQLGRFPEAARQGPQVVQQQLVDVRALARLRDEELRQAVKEYDRLADIHQKRQELEEEKLAVEGKLKHHKTLTELLGRDRLQLHLVRQAERQVVDHANAMLDRLSGGELYLRLCGEAGGEGNTAKALELEAHNRVTGEKPINVAFLSGSQKFRVAVSLALGIGQYASRQHRPIESVIIDEGFGCLDRNARQVMIQELQNLRSQMRCILLVSHQEEFADAFTDGYHFELQNGTTVARRFQR